MNRRGFLSVVFAPAVPLRPTAPVSIATVSAFELVHQSFIAAGLLRAGRCLSPADLGYGLSILSQLVSRETGTATRVDAAFKIGVRDAYHYRNLLARDLGVPWVVADSYRQNGNTFYVTRFTERFVRAK